MALCQVFADRFFWIIAVPLAGMVASPESIAEGFHLVAQNLVRSPVSAVIGEIAESNTVAMDPTDATACSKDGLIGMLEIC
jgi:hypothetical protein